MTRGGVSLPNLGTSRPYLEGVPQVTTRQEQK